jgi:hypothetical protein
MMAAGCPCCCVPCGCAAAMVSPSPVRVLALLVVMATRRVCTAATTQEAALLQQPRQQFSVDLGGPPSPQPFDSAAVTRCFGSSHAATAMRADWQRELAQVQKDLGVEYVRFHGLLDDDMSVVIPGRMRRSVSVSSSAQCTFVEHQDFRDMGANVVNASSKEECCHKCYTEPTGSIVRMHVSVPSHAA